MRTQWNAPVYDPTVSYIFLTFLIIFFFFFSP
uniref:Uncharacterized protein n=1 Tax=Anguilla anguilla TaxID=7936 RepID=A0A0E9PGN3_ANGAN